jgi:CheY-like chemotaxis protein
MKNILIVEDDPFSKEFYNLILKRAGYNPYVTDRADELEDILIKANYSLIIMDINLKKTSLHGERVDGIMISSFLKNDDRYSHIPIILVTAYSTASIKGEMLVKSKAEGLITKPITDINLFISQLENVMLN